MSVGSLKKGLTDQEVLRSRERYESNKIPEPESFWDKFEGSFENPMIRLLCVIAVIHFAMWLLGQAGICDLIVTLIAIFVVAFVSAKIELSNERRDQPEKEVTECK